MVIGNATQMRFVVCTDVIVISVRDFGYTKLNLVHLSQKASYFAELLYIFPVFSTPNVQACRLPTCQKYLRSWDQG